MVYSPLLRPPTAHRCRPLAAGIRPYRRFELSWVSPSPSCPHGFLFPYLVSKKLFFFQLVGYSGWRWSSFFLACSVLLTISGSLTLVIPPKFYSVLVGCFKNGHTKRKTHTHARSLSSYNWFRRLQKTITNKHFLHYARPHGFLLWKLQLKKN